MRATHASRIAVAAALLLCLCCCAAADALRAAPTAGAAAKRPATTGDDEAFVCVFLHGVGQAGPSAALQRVPDPLNRTADPAFVRSSFPRYWGDMHERAAAAGCTRVVMYWTNTVARGWNDSSLQTEYCGVLARTGAHVVFSHSMANLVLAGAVLNGVAGCADRLAHDDGDGTAGADGDDARAHTTTHWYGLQGPLKGTIGADLLHQLCPNPIVARLMKGCRRSRKRAGQWTIGDAYRSLQTTATPPALAATAQRLMSGNLCGLLAGNTAASFHDASPRANGGFWTTFEKAATDLALSVISAAVGAMEHADRYPDGAHRDFARGFAATGPAAPGAPVPRYANDGLVGFSSCRAGVPRASFRGDPASPYYAFDGNHSDGRCKFGEDARAGGTQPCRWMANMVRRAAAAFGIPLTPRRPAASPLPPPHAEPAGNAKVKAKRRPTADRKRRKARRPATRRVKTLKASDASLEEVIESALSLS